MLASGVHQVRGEAARNGLAWVHPQIDHSAVLVRAKKPIKLRAALLRSASVREIGINHFRSSGRRAELGLATLQEWRTKRDVLRPGNRTVATGEVFDALRKADHHPIFGQVNLPLELELRQRQRRSQRNRL